MVEVLVKVSLSATELKLLRRALAKAADDGLRLSRVGSGPAQYDSAPPVLPERYLRRLNA